MKFSNLIDRLKGIATEASDFEDVRDTVIMIKNEDGTYVEVTSDEHN